MEFRSPAVATQQNAKAVAYLTKSLTDREAGRLQVESLIKELGNAVDTYPDWHPLLTAPPRREKHIYSLSQLETYSDLDHTIEFVRGFVSCPYTEERADRIVNAVTAVAGLHAYRLDTPLYHDQAHPVVVEATNVEIDAEGTIRGRDALAWFVHQTAIEATTAEVAETWWNIRSNILGSPHGSRSSLFVDQHTGGHMRKILEALNHSGMFGPIKESSLDMLSQKKRNNISELLIRTAVSKWDKKSGSFDFEMRDEICKATLRDTWEDNTEISVRVKIGDYDLYISGFYYPKNDKITHTEPRGKRELAEKFA